MWTGDVFQHMSGMECSPKTISSLATSVYTSIILLTLITLGECKNCPDNMIATNYTQYFMSVNYPGKYKNDLDCKWNMTSNEPYKRIKIVIIEMDIEYDSDGDCKFDFLEIFDGLTLTSLGRFCGGLREKVIYGDSGILYFHFKTDSNINKDGFKIKYVTEDISARRSTPKPPDFGKDDKDKFDENKKENFGAEDKKPPHVAVIVGGVIGGLCILLITGTVGCLCSTRICRQCNGRDGRQRRTSVSPHSSTNDIRSNETRSIPLAHLQPYQPRCGNNHRPIRTCNMGDPYVVPVFGPTLPAQPISPPPYQETDILPVYLPAPYTHPYISPSSPPPTYSFGLSSDSNPPAYEDDQPPPNYVP